MARCEECGRAGGIGCVVECDEGFVAVVGVDVAVDEACWIDPCEGDAAAGGFLAEEGDGGGVVLDGQVVASLAPRACDVLAEC